MFISIELQFDYKFKYNGAKTHYERAHYKKFRLFWSGILVKKKSPYGFFAPMSNLTKVLFWTS